jgi:HD-GYP domain-containing protein (c-di-GMP phosphodiesterase class II)
MPKKPVQPKLSPESMNRIRGLESEIAAIIGVMREKVRQLELLNSFSQILNSTLNAEEVREKALEATCELLRCETASLLLLDAEKNELYWETALGDAGKELQKTLRLAVNEKSIAGFVALSGESLVLNDVQSDPRHFKKRGSPVGLESDFVTQTMICVPLKRKDRIVGVLQAINKSPHAQAHSTAKHPWPEFSVEDRTLLETLSHQVAIAIENAKLYGDIKKSFYDTVEALAEAIEKKDRYTGGHTKRVVHYSLCIAKYMNLTQDQVEQIRLGAILHDVGKIGIEDKILKKNSPLDPSEWEVMQTHPEQGYDILARVEGLKHVIGGMRYHHERWDGKGYPTGLKGEEIPLIARIISVADTYDAMVSTRPYRKGIDPQVAYDEIVRYRGTQFDPEVVDAFVQAFKNEKMGRGSGGSTYGGGEAPSTSGSPGASGSQGPKKPGVAAAPQQTLSNCD